MRDTVCSDRMRTSSTRSRWSSCPNIDFALTGCPRSSNGRFGSKPEVPTPTRHFRSTPDSRHRYADRSGPFSCQTRKWTVSLNTTSAQRCWLHSNAEHPEPFTKHRYRRLGLLLGLVPPPPPPGLRLLPVSNGSFALDRGSGGTLGAG